MIEEKTNIASLIFLMYSEWLSSILGHLKATKGDS